MDNEISLLEEQLEEKENIFLELNESLNHFFTEEFKKALQDKVEPTTKIDCYLTYTSLRINLNNSDKGFGLEFSVYFDEKWNIDSGKDYRSRTKYLEYSISWCSTTTKLSETNKLDYLIALGYLAESAKNNNGIFSIIKEKYNLYYSKKEEIDTISRKIYKLKSERDSGIKYTLKNDLIRNFKDGDVYNLSVKIYKNRNVYDQIIALVEKVSKKTITVKFYSSEEDFKIDNFTDRRRYEHSIFADMVIRQSSERIRKIAESTQNYLVYKRI